MCSESGAHRLKGQTWFKDTTDTSIFQTGLSRCLRCLPLWWAFLSNDVSKNPAKSNSCNFSRSCKNLEACQPGAVVSGTRNYLEAFRLIHQRSTTPWPGNDEGLMNQLDFSNNIVEASVGEHDVNLSVLHFCFDACDETMVVEQGLTDEANVLKLMEMVECK